MKLPGKIIQLRKSRGLSQEQLADMLSVSRQAVSRWEVGTAMPDASNILQLSKLFGVTSDYLLNDDYENDADIPLVKTLNEKCGRISSRKKKLHLVAGICFSAALLMTVACLLMSGGTQSGLKIFSAVMMAGCAAAQFILYFRS